MGVTFTSCSGRPKKVALYARCSTQRDQNPQVQVEELRRYCQARAWEIKAEIVDGGYSGTRTDRPGLMNLMTLVQSRKIDVIVVVKLDRLFRSLKHMVLALQDFSDLGIEFISIKDQLDLTTASGRLMVHLISAFAEFERELIVERTLLGLEHARAIGKTLGRPQIRDDGEILALRKQGLSYRAIQRKLGCSSGAINRALSAASKSVSPMAVGSHLKTKCKNE